MLTDLMCVVGRARQRQRWQEEEKVVYLALLGGLERGLERGQEMVSVVLRISQHWQRLPGVEVRANIAGKAQGEGQVSK
jgi:hypothetical protein